MGNKRTKMKKTKKSNFKKFKSYVGIIASLCTIITATGALFSYIIKLNIISILIIFIIKHISYIFLLCFVVCFILNQYIIPRHKVYKEDIPKEEAKPSKILSTILVFAIVMNSMYIFIPPLLNYATLISLPKEPTIYVVEFPYESNYYTEPINEENTLTPLQRTVEKYIILCYIEIIPQNIWRTLSDEELYYIRNGIFAYSHAQFDLNFYDVYSWYDGTIDINEFDWNVFNEYQRKNIENISAVENERKQ